MKTCPKCNKEVVEGWKLCPYCGESLQQNECPACHKQVQPDWNRCPFCGELLKNQASQTPSVSNSTNDLFDYSEIEAGLDRQLAHNAEYEKKVIKARTLAIRRMYDEAKAIYDGLIEDDPTDMNGYMGLIRIESKNYTEYEGEGIEEAIRIAKQINFGEEIEQYDPDYADYSARREKYFADKAEAERKAKEEAERKAKAEAERKAKEEAERKAKEEAERKAREEAERKAKETAERKAEEARRAEEEREAQEEAERKTRETVKGRSLAIRGMYAEAKAVYDAIIDADPADMNGYMGLIRVAAKNYTEYEGEEIEKTIRIAKQMSGGEEIEQYDPDYADYSARREKYFAEKAEAERKAKEEAERKAKEEARKAREEAAIPHREGNKIIFGLWPQSGKALYVTVGGSADGDGYYTGSDGALYAKVGDKYFKVEPIEWQILSESGGKAMILSKAILANMAYHGLRNNYANSDVRKWLNGEFYNKAFSAKSKNYIETSLVDNSAKITGCSSNECACENTNDKVYLLSYEEAFKEYGLTDSSRQKKPTEYAKATGADVSDNGNGWWWLRSPFAAYEDRARYVCGGGYDHSISSVDNSSNGVVPALVIKLN